MLSYESVAPINTVLAVKFDSAFYPYDTEPVTLQEVKDYAKIDYDDDDTLITALITEAREQLEKYTGLAFIIKTMTCQLQNDCGDIEIPYGPIYGELDPTLITDYDGNEISIQTYGLDYLSIRTKASFIQIICSTGFEDCPESLKTAIKAQVFFMYENRGERLSFDNASTVRVYNVDYICNAAQTLAFKYRRNLDGVL